MAKIVCRKSGRFLIPVDDEGSEALKRIRDGKDVMVEFKQSRNPRFHRLYWAMVRFVRLHAVNDSGESLFASADDEIVHTAIKIATGFVRTFVDTTTGKTAFVPKSINWEALDEGEFSKFFDNAVNVITNRWLPPGTHAAEVSDEIIRMVDGPNSVMERVA